MSDTLHTFGITQYWGLSHKNHFLKLKQNVSSRVALVRKLSKTNWGTSFDTLRISAAELLYAPAEHCAVSGAKVPKQKH